MSNLSRRTLVSTAAALPALSIPALASVEPDPIYAALDRCRRAEADVEAAAELIGKNHKNWPVDKTVRAEDQLTELSGISQRAFTDLVCMTPTTVTGCAALLRHVQEHENRY